MKKMSIKLRITLYFTLILFLLSAVMMGYIIAISTASAENELEKTLESHVDDLYNKVYYKPTNAPSDSTPNGNQPPFPPNDGNKNPGSMRDPEQHKTYKLIVPTDYSFRDGDVALYIYEEGENATIYGQLFDGLYFDDDTAKNEAIVKQRTDKKEYLVYARFIKEGDKKESDGAWVVGAIDNDIVNTIVYDTLKYAIVALPVIILLAAAFGYIVTKRAFRPVAEITNAANEIANGSDLSKRINLGEGGDEIFKLASTVDSMLETIQRDFEREKQFTNDASHELRTPVSIIMAQSELALDSKASDNDRIEALESINRQSHRVNKLLAELLNLARSDNGKTVLEKESFDLTELAEMVIEEKSAFAEAKSISLRLVSNEPVMVVADQTLLMRVLINLITNSVKYGKEGGLTEVSVERKGENGAVCRVKDNGIGISKDDIDKVWNRFFRADTARTFDENGSFGLGLPMVKSIVEAHGGTVKAESVLGEGSVFEFTI